MSVVGCCLFVFRHHYALATAITTISAMNAKIILARALLSSLVRGFNNSITSLAKLCALALIVMILILGCG